MKKIFLVLALLAGCLSLDAKSDDDQKPLYISVQGGTAINVYENYFTIASSDRSMFTWQGAVAVGYDIIQGITLRLQLESGKNIGACNVLQTSGGGFYPYNFYNVNGFADVILDLKGRQRMEDAFRPKLVGGVGAAYTFGFTDSGHPWQVVEKDNLAFGFRLGGIAEYNLNSSMAIFAEFTGEFFSDGYNGLQPSKKDKEQFTGYPGLPLDVRGLLSVGMLYRF